MWNGLDPCRSGWMAGGLGGWVGLGQASRARPSVELLQVPGAGETQVLGEGTRQEQGTNFGGYLCERKIDAGKLL